MFCDGCHQWVWAVYINGKHDKLCERCVNKMSKKGKIEIKNVDVLKALLNLKIDHSLMDIILWVASKYGICFTEGWRAARRSGDVHNTVPLRAVDLRSWFYQPTVAEDIEWNINKIWEYDPNRPDMKCAWIHDSGNGIHFHIQTHPNTRRRQ